MFKWITLSMTGLNLMLSSANPENATLYLVAFTICLVSFGVQVTCEMLMPKKN